ncbi:MAG: hypothetical protein PHF63_04410 [Herbinix sp.]|nr:hypothetical protein [Herbinix sp.]
MNPITQNIGLPSSSIQPNNDVVFVPGIFASYEEVNDYLSSLDSDTRDYVIKHTSEFRSRADIIDCVNKLHGEG